MTSNPEIRMRPTGSCTMKAGARESADLGMTIDGRDLKLSRVSILREMFQTGVIRPIEEIDYVSPQSIPQSEQKPNDINLQRTLPGSPHLSALRNTPKQTATPRCGEPIRTAQAASKPRPNVPFKDLINPTPATKRSPSPEVPAVGSCEEASNPSLKSSIALFENAASSVFSKQPTILDTQVQPNTVKRAQSIFEKPQTDSTHRAGSPSFRLFGRSPSMGSSDSSSPNRLRDKPRFNNAPQSSPSKSSTQHSSGVSDIVPGSPNKTPVVQTDAFRELSAASSRAFPMDGSLSGLQHTKPIAVATPERTRQEINGSIDGEVSASLNLSEVIDRPNAPVPTLPIPTGLKLVAVDSMGVHILDDGNFFYTTPGLSSRPESPSESSSMADSSFSSKSMESSQSLLKAKSKGSSVAGVVGTAEFPLPDSSSDCIRKKVHFSSEPILVFSTHSQSEYDRRNEDIDPLSASAEYELEKQLEDMEFVEVDMKKTSQGLGISILGLGVDNVNGEQKLGIFIKAVTPGGAADLCGKIQAYDQIVEVNGTNLVGVSQIFAAQTLRNTGETIHFVLAREQDPSQSRVAKMLAEQEEETESNPTTTQQSPSRVAPNTLPRDDSMETLQKLLAAGATSPTTGDYPSTHNAADWQGDHDDEDEEGTTTTGHFSGVVSSSPLPISSSPFSPTNPRSALKGTATAASTKRRQDAIDQLIRLASQRAGALPVPLPEDENYHPVLIVLASDLYDCHCQLVKAQAQVLSLEQQLTSQEAAADETIERLCLQCRHMEMELNESQERLKEYIQQSSTEAFNKCTVLMTPMNGHDQVEGTAIDDIGQNIEIPSHSPVHDGNYLNGPVQQPKPTIDQSSIERSCKAQSGCNTSLLSIHERKRFLVSSGLVPRRPPSKVTINPLPVFVPGTEEILDRFIPHFSPPKFPKSCHSGHVTNSSFHSPDIDCLQPGDEIRQYSADPGCICPPLPAHKVLGIQLPGITEASSQPFVFNRRSVDSSPISTTKTTSLLSLSPRTTTKTN